MSAAATPAPTRRRRPGRPRNQDSAVIRERILLAAVDLIARQGYAATSMAQVAEAAGVSPSGLVHHFGSKKALLGAVLEHRDAVDSDPRPPIGQPPGTCSSTSSASPGTTWTAARSCGSTRRWWGRP